MGVFDDKKFEQLDWMSQITETIESEINGLLARLPDRIEITTDMISEEASSSSFYLTSDRVVQRLLWRTVRKLGKNLSYDEEQKLASCYKFEVSPDCEIDLEKLKMTGTINLVKVTQTLPDEALQELMGQQGLEAIRVVSFDSVNPPLDRMNEIMDMLGGCETEMRNRSARKKLVQIRGRLGDILRKNEWRIRDMNLANKIGFWAAGYIEKGNLADFVNFCKLKVMTHNNMPIYSIEEEK